MFTCRFSTSMKFYCESILPNHLDDYMIEKDNRVKRDSIPGNLKAVYETLKYEVFNEYLKILIICNIAHFEEFIGSERSLNNFWQTCIRLVVLSADFSSRCEIRIE